MLCGLWVACSQLLWLLSSLAPRVSESQVTARDPVADTAEQTARTPPGKKLFEAHCARCHGMQGTGGSGANLCRPRLQHAASDRQLRSVIRSGIAGTGMPGNWFLSDNEVRDAAAYVCSLGAIASTPPAGSPQRGQQIYDTAECAKCHILAGQGAALAPDLTQVGARRGLEHLRAAILHPAQQKMRDTRGYASYLAAVYVLDRETGEFISATPYAKQTWAERIDDSGRPIRIPGREPSEGGTLVYPSLQGATNWFSPAYSPQTKLFYVSVREMGAYYFKSDVDFEAGQPFLGGGEQALQGDEAWGAVRGLDVTTGLQKWEFRLHSPPWSGLLATAGGLVFGGTNEGNFFALDADSGEPLWQFQTGGAIRANPISYAVDGDQQVLIASGNAIIAFGR